MVISIQCKSNIRLANSGDPGQTLRLAASDLGLFFSSLSHRKDAKLIWVNGKMERN